MKVQRTTNAHDRQPVGRFGETGGTYFLTWRLAGEQPALSSVDRDVVANTLCYFANVRYWLHAWVVMDDHVHVVVTPIAPSTIDTISHSWRSFSAGELCRRFGRTPPLWLRGRYDRIVHADGELDEKVMYVRMNPWRRWPDCVAYPWVWPKIGGEPDAPEPRPDPAMRDGRRT